MPSGRRGRGSGSPARRRSPPGWAPRCDSWRGRAQRAAGGSASVPLPGTGFPSREREQAEGFHFISTLVSPAQVCALIRDWPSVNANEAAAARLLQGGGAPPQHRVPRAGVRGSPAPPRSSCLTGEGARSLGRRLSTASLLAVRGSLVPPAGWSPPARSERRPAQPRGGSGPQGSISSGSQRPGTPHSNADRRRTGCLQVSD